MTTDKIHPRDAAEAMSDKDLVAAYVKDAAESDLGVSYYLAQEMEARGFRNPNTGALIADVVS